MRITKNVIVQLLQIIENAFMGFCQSLPGSTNRERQNYIVLDTIEVGAFFDIFVDVSDVDLYKAFGKIESSFKEQKIDLQEALERFQKLLFKYMSKMARSILKGKKEYGPFPLTSDLDKAMNRLLAKLRHALMMHVSTNSVWRESNTLAEIEVTYKACLPLGIFEDEYGYESLIQYAKNARPVYQRDQRGYDDAMHDVTKEFNSLLESYMAPFAKMGTVPSETDIEEDEL